MITISTQEPFEITAGDTLKFKKILPAYPAKKWILTYYLVKSGTQIVFTATADGNDFLINVPSSVTKSWPAGTYKLEAYVTKEGERYKVVSSTIEIKPNLAAYAEGLDTRSYVKRVLDAIEDTLVGRANRDADQIKIGEQYIAKASIEQLRKWRAEYADMYKAELARERLKYDRKIKGNSIKTRF
jgi:hypothetical protein